MNFKFSDGSTGKEASQSSTSIVEKIPSTLEESSK